MTSPIRREEYPVLIGEAMANTDLATGEHTKRRVFPFLSWASSVGFKYPEHAAPYLRHCGSAAEAFFVREFAQRRGVKFDQTHPATATCRGVQLHLQAQVGKYFVDAAVFVRRYRLAIEIDGLGFHHRLPSQISADYLRERRLVLAGFAVIRFTAQEVFSDPTECWRQIDLILQRNA